MIDRMPIDVELAKLEYHALDSALGEATLRPKDEQVRCERAWHEARELAARWGPKMFQFITGERLTLFVGSGWETDAGPAPDSDFPNDRYIGFYSVGLVLRAGLAPLLVSGAAHLQSDVDAAFGYLRSIGLPISHMCWLGLCEGEGSPELWELS